MTVQPLNESRKRFALALGEAVVALWGELPQHINKCFLKRPWSVVIMMNGTNRCVDNLPSISMTIIPAQHRRVKRLRRSATPAEALKNSDEAMHAEADGIRE